MEFIKQNYLDNLNQKQKEAIVNPDGPCLIVAGAGSGKTRVLTSRVVHIIKEKKAWPNQILCVTFTNKAAREMKERLELLLARRLATNQLGQPWDTLHAVEQRQLRNKIYIETRFILQ